MLWYEQKNNTAVSTRVRLARNLAKVPFPSHMPLPKLRETVKTISEAVGSCDFGDIKLRKINMETLGEPEAYAMVERHSVSPKFAKDRDGRVLFLSDDESVSIMVGEEDHLRIQVLLPGERFAEAYSICDKIETEIGKHFEYAFDEKLGYLTECPTNLGTGMRASVMLHLPVLESLGELRAISDAVGKIGLTFRGFYGEGSESKAGMYQLSNQITLGVSEKAAIDNLKNITEQIIAKETEAAETLDKNALTDLVYRSFGTLKYARKMSTEEMMKHCSRLMLGERAGVIELPQNVVPMSFFINLQPAMIKRIKGELDPNERDIFRADSLRNALKNVEI